MKDHLPDERFHAEGPLPTDAVGPNGSTPAQQVAGAPTRGGIAPAGADGSVTPAWVTTETGPAGVVAVKGVPAGSMKRASR